MMDNVAPDNFAIAVAITRMAKALLHAPDAMLENAAARLLAYEQAGLAGFDYDTLDAGAVASERARRRAFREVA
jgi:hypothetical protein